MSMTHGGKGSAQRPGDKKKFNDNWDRIFGKKEPEVKPEVKTEKADAKSIRS